MGGYAAQKADPVGNQANERRKDPPARSGTSGWTYNAFLSYSHAADGRLAPGAAAQPATPDQGLVPAAGAARVPRSGQPRREPRPVGNIKRALRRSHYFVLLASPEGARSEWVGREVGFWQEHRQRETFLIALTDGTIRWDNRAGDFDWNSTDALPDRLRGWFSREPLWVDLSWTRTLPAGQLSLRHARFRDNAGMLAAAVHERRKDQIDSEDARQHRRATLFGRGIIAVLTALLLIAGVGWYNANVQRHDAEQQRSVAEQQRDLATGRAMEAEAENLATTQPQTSLQLSLAALRIDPTTQVRATLVNTLLQTHYDGSSPPQDPNGLGGTAVFSPDGRMLAAITGQNHAVLWNTTDPTHPVPISVLPAGSTTFASGGIKFSPDERLLAIAKRRQSRDPLERRGPAATGGHGHRPGPV